MNEVIITKKVELSGGGPKCKCEGGTGPNKSSALKKGLERNENAQKKVQKYFLRKVPEEMEKMLVKNILLHKRGNRMEKRN